MFCQELTATKPVSFNLKSAEIEPASVRTQAQCQAQLSVSLVLGGAQREQIT